ncbi:solute carrier family 35 member F6 isoform X1 [Pocillopora verrucosa]|uniref:solute carrier family 35 member F6 isoform X1 n=2 Tax=Pocillopora verrucosa TaxID=203993 RepID=UPI003340E8B5
MAGLTRTQILLTVGMLIAGSLNTVTLKAQNNCSARGLKDMNGKEEHQFEHPWIQTALMFLGEMICLIGLFIHQRKERLKYKQRLLHDGIDGRSYKEATQTRKSLQRRVFQWIFAFPALCDLCGTTLATIGLLYVKASVWQMLRGSIIIFTGLLSKIFLKRKLWPIHWIGMIVTVVGLVLVGLSSVLRDKEASHPKAGLGIAFILMGQCVSATQYIVEERFLKEKNFHPLQVVGMEGFFGFTVMAAVVLPVLYFIPGSQPHHSYENSLDALLMIKNDTTLATLIVFYTLSIAFYNFFGLTLTKSLTAVHRTLIDACRTIVVWAVELFIHYALHEDFGETWDRKYSIFQVDGFLFLMLGTALYNELLIIPPLMPKPDASQQDQASNEIENGDVDLPENEPFLRGIDKAEPYTGVM